MKKVALSLLAFALVGAMAFGQDAAAAPVVTIGDWGRQIFSVGNMTDKEAAANGYYAGTGTSWTGSNARIVGLNIQAKTDTVGFSITPNADNGFGLSDQNKAWINPMPGLQVETGISLETDTWRSTAGFGSWNWLRFQGTAGDSWAFKRLGNGNMATDINYNKDGIGAWALWDQGAVGKGQAVNQSPATQMQVGAAYLLPSIGTVKAQYLGTNVGDGGGIIGMPTKKNTSAGVINAAFDFIGMENLTESVGLYIPTSASDLGYVMQLADFTAYKMDKVTLNLMFGLSVPQTDNKGDSDMALMGGVGADYDLGDSMSFGGDIRYTNPQALTNGVKSSATGVKDGMTGFFAGVTKGFSNGLIGVGFEYSTIAIGATPQTDNSVGHWAIPVRLEEWF